MVEDSVPKVEAIDKLCQTVAGALTQAVTTKPVDDEEDEAEEQEALIMDILECINLLVMKSEKLTIDLFNTNAVSIAIALLASQNETLSLLALDLITNIADKIKFGPQLIDLGVLTPLANVTTMQIAKEAKVTTVTTTTVSTDEQQPPKQEPPNKYLRNAIKILGCLALEDKCLPMIMKSYGIIAQVIPALINFSKDTMIRRNACIALGNLAREGTAK